MKRRILPVFLAFSIFILGQISQAAESGGGDSWYFMAQYKPVISPSYSGDVKDILDRMSAKDHSYMGFDYGVYWRLGSIYLGPQVVNYNDKFTRTGSGFDQVAVGFIGAAVLYPLISNDPARGLFVRGDLGFSIINRPGNFLFVFENNQSKVAEGGFGAQLNLGFSFFISNFISLVPLVTYGYFPAGGSNYSFFSASLGIML